MVILSIAGIVLVSSHISSADARALQNQQPREVYLVTVPIAEGTPVEELGESLKLQTVPAVTVPEDAVTSLSEYKGKVAGVDLKPGEQVLSSRLVDPQVLEAPGTIPVPKGLQEVTVQLDAARVVGGQLKAGDTVGFFASFPEPDRTDMKLHKVLVTSVQGAAAAEAPAEGEEPVAGSAPPVPEGGMLVTLAVKADTAEEIIFSAEFGSIWLSHEPDDAEENNNGARMEDFK